MKTITAQALSVAERTRNLKPGESIRLSGDAKQWVTAERSGDGKTLRIIRHRTNGFEVFYTGRF